MARTPRARQHFLKKRRPFFQPVVEPVQKGALCEHHTGRPARNAEQGKLEKFVHHGMDSDEHFKQFPILHAGHWHPYQQRLRSGSHTSAIFASRFSTSGISTLAGLRVPIFGGFGLPRRSCLSALLGITGIIEILLFSEGAGSRSQPVPLCISQDAG